EFPKEFILEALNNSYDDTGWAYIGTFGGYLTKLKPDFDSRLYGFKKLSDLVKGKPEIFETEERVNPGSNTKVLYLRGRQE
ncbi:TPA: OST-HTH/LOTUS domain-containing protein, partial [Legionella pneumophila]